MRDFPSHRATDETQVSRKFAVDLSFYAFGVPKTASTRKSIVARRVEQDDIIYPESEATRLVLKDQALNAKGVQPFAFPVERIQVEQSILLADPVVDIEMRVDGLYIPLKDRLVEPKADANFV